MNINEMTITIILLKKKKKMKCFMVYRSEKSRNKLKMWRSNSDFAEKGNWVRDI